MPDPDTLREQLERFNEARRRFLGGVPPTADEPMMLPRTGVGGDVDGDEDA
jgi:hypothetical protein